MYISKYNSVDVVNGEGTRTSLFVSGCIHACRGCYNQKTWRSDFGHEFTQEMEDKIITDLQDTFIKRRGISLSGGDPLFVDNLTAIKKIIDRIRKECPKKDIWLWSGYTLEELRAIPVKTEVDELRLSIAESVDVFIDGKFEKDKFDPDLKWRGSENQIIHTFKSNNF